MLLAIRFMIEKKFNYEKGPFGFSGTDDLDDKDLAQTATDNNNQP